MKSRQFFDQENLKSEDYYSFNDYTDYRSTRIGYIGVGRFGLRMLAHYYNSSIFANPIMLQVMASQNASMDTDVSCLYFDGETTEIFSENIKEFIEFLDVVFIYADDEESYALYAVREIKTIANGAGCMIISMILDSGIKSEKVLSEYGNLVYAYNTEADFMNGMCYKKHEFKEVEDAFCFTTSCLERYVYREEDYHIKAAVENLFSITQRNHICTMSFQRLYFRDLSISLIQRNLLRLIDLLAKIKTSNISGALICCYCSFDLSDDTTKFIKAFIQEYLGDKVLFRFDQVSYKEWDEQYLELYTVVAVKSIVNA